MGRTGKSSILDLPIYLGIRAAMTGLLISPQEPTLRTAERLGRAFGDARFNRTRLDRAEQNLGVAFPDWDRDRVRETALNCYSHLFRLGVETAFASRLLSEDAWVDRLELDRDIGPAVESLVSAGPCLLITGHCGNWELLGYTMALLGFPMHALYRPIDLKPLDAWVRDTRQRRGLVLVDKFGAVRRLPSLLRNGAPIGFVADQNGGDRGVMVPYFGRLTSTYKSIGLLAMEFGATVVCGAAVRQPGPDLRYRVIATDVIAPEDWQAQPDPLFYLTARYRRAMERMVRTAPEQYLWMHRIWRSRPAHERQGKPFPERLKDKLRSLPWIGEEDLDRIVHQSALDAATLARTGATRLS
jgi:KDO2-lipid IV(A) lauroyltransferase